MKGSSPVVLVWMEWMEGEELDEEWKQPRWESPLERVETLKLPLPLLLLLPLLQS